MEEDRTEEERRIMDAVSRRMDMATGLQVREICIARLASSIKRDMQP